MTCYLVENQVFLCAATKHKSLGAHCSEARPLLLYAGGSWVSDSGKEWLVPKCLRNLLNHLLGTLCCILAKCLAGTGLLDEE